MALRVVEAPGVPGAAVGGLRVDGAVLGDGAGGVRVEGADCSAAVRAAGAAGAGVRAAGAAGVAGVADGRLEAGDGAGPGRGAED